MRNKVLLFPLALAILLAVTFRPPPGQEVPPPPSPAAQEAPPPAEPPDPEEPETTPSGPGPPPEAHVIEGCTVTWYTEATCGKAPDHPAYGITASGLPVEEGVTCAVDPEVIPLFSTVYVEYADGSAGTFRATDTGVEGEWVDIYTPDYDYAILCGMQRLTVYWTGPEE
nr:3D domain-containing protein [uncultured Oscillibacter sp.]